MSSNYPDPFQNPFGSQPNPYASPQGGNFKGFGDQNFTSNVRGKLLPPAIYLCTVGSLGLVMSVVNIVLAMVIEAPPVDPNADDFMKGFQQGQSGPIAAAIQSIFVIVNLVIIAGAVQMMRVKTKPMGIASAILAMVNFGTCCCILGLPAGIWSLVILMQPDVSRAFERNSG